MAKSKQLTRLELWHHDLIDWWIANPRASGREAAAHFGVCDVWISIVKHSPIFQAEFKRRRERLSCGVEDKIRSRATAAVEVALDAILERLERDRETIPVRDVSQIVKTGAGLLGLRGRVAVAPPERRCGSRWIRWRWRRREKGLGGQSLGAIRGRSGNDNAGRTLGKSGKRKLMICREVAA